MNQQQKQYKVILIGDACIDEYHYGMTKPSPEANVPIFKLKRIEKKDGMVLNVYNNLKQFNLDISLYFGNLSIKKRLVDDISKNNICRIDEDVTSNDFNQFNQLEKIKDEIDIVIISDYNKGFISNNTILKIQNIFQNIPIFIDTKKQDLSKFINNYNNTYFKINELEYKQLISKHDNMIITRSDKSILYNNKEFNIKKVDVIDVCGAGDTFLASLAYKFLITGNMEESIYFSSCASSITIQKIGVYAPTLKEINAIYT